MKALAQPGRGLPKVRLGLPALCAGFLLAALGLGFVSAAEEKQVPPNPAAALAKVAPGQNPEQVRETLGVGPHRIARQLLYHRYREQWTYDQPYFVRLEFDCPRGQKPQLISIQKLAPGQP
jgi:hypothetical protein